MNFVDSWTYQRMRHEVRPCIDNIDELSNRWSYALSQENQVLFKKASSEQHRIGMNVQMYIASIMYFSSSCKWKEKNNSQHKQ